MRVLLKPGLPVPSKDHGFLSSGQPCHFLCMQMSQAGGRRASVRSICIGSPVIACPNWVQPCTLRLLHSTALAQKSFWKQVWASPPCAPLNGLDHLGDWNEASDTEFNSKQLLSWQCVHMAQKKALNGS